MQEVNNIETGQQSAPFVQENNKVETTQANLNEEKPKQNSFLTTLLSILLLLSCIIAGFFAYQTQDLVKELTKLKSKTESTPIATSLPTEAPTATGSAVVTEIKDWKTYANISSKYEVAYPDDWVIENVASGSMGNVTSDARYIQISPAGAKHGTFGIEEMQMIPPSEEANLNSTKVVGNLTLRCNGNFTNDSKTWCWVKVPNQEKYLNIQVFKNVNVEVNKILDQILSTFKFTN